MHPIPSRADGLGGTARRRTTHRVATMVTTSMMGVSISSAVLAPTRGTTNSVRIVDLPTGPDHIVLYQKNIEAVCSNETEVREQIRLTVIHELGHYFGMDENQLKDV